MIFDNSEYVKDGLMPLTELLGKTPWTVRMVGIIDDILKHAPIKTAAGMIPSTNDEVNGEMMQMTARLYFMTGKKAYLDAACRMADWYLLGDRHPTRDVKKLRLRDHGCELISGLSEVYFACHHARKTKADAYRKPMHAMLDRILEVGVNEHGMMYDTIDPQSGKVLSKRISDNWGYNYNAFYTVYLVDKIARYRDATRKALSNLNANYRNFRWEGTSHDGYADSIECAINLYNREPMASTAAWIDSEMQVMLKMQKPSGIIGGWHGDGNFARTAILWALMKQQGVTIQPWRADVKLGAVTTKQGIKLLISAQKPWTGKLIFDTPRHKTVMHMPEDYPRINQFPEWFTVEAKTSYTVNSENLPTKTRDGKALQSGLTVKLHAGQTLKMTVQAKP